MHLMIQSIVVFLLQGRNLWAIIQEVGREATNMLMALMARTANCFVKAKVYLLGLGKFLLVFNALTIN